MKIFLLSIMEGTILTAAGVSYLMSDKSNCVRVDSKAIPPDSSFLNSDDGSFFG